MPSNLPFMARMFFMIIYFGVKFFECNYSFVICCAVRFMKQEDAIGFRGGVEFRQGTNFSSLISYSLLNKRAK